MTSFDRPAASFTPVEAGAPPTGKRSRRLRATAFAAMVVSAGLVGLGLTWLLAPETARFGDGMPTLASAILGPAAVASVTAALGAAGVVLASVLAARVPIGGEPVVRRVLGAAAAAFALVIALALGSLSTVALAGYLFGLVAVVAGLGTVAIMLVRSPRLGWALLAGLAALSAIAVWWAGLTAQGIAEFGLAFAGALVDDAAVLLVTAIVLAATLIWAAMAVVLLRRGRTAHIVEAWLVRHRRAITILAAFGPIPYAFARASWLTPWPLFGPSAEELEPAMLATGLMLGSGAIAASILTLGLILPWGRTVPNWLPRIGGRPVPVGAAAVPGFVAAGILCISAPPMLALSFTNPGSPIDALVLNLVLPLWFWGPTLALAVWAYAAWRRRDAASGTPIVER
jgi:hypothetical protein